MPPPITRASHFSMSASITLILSETFEPPKMATNGRFGSSSMPVSVPTSRCIRKPAYAGSSSATPAVEACARVRGAERVVDVDIAKGSELPAERGVVLLLALVEAQVLEHEHLAVGECRRFRLRVGAHGVGREDDGRAQKLRQAARCRSQRERFFEALAGRTAAMAHKDRAGAVLPQVLDGGQRRADAGVVGDTRRP